MDGGWTDRNCRPHSVAARMGHKTHVECWTCCDGSRVSCCLLPPMRLPIRTIVNSRANRWERCMAVLDSMGDFRLVMAHHGYDFGQLERTISTAFTAIVTALSTTVPRWITRHRICTSNYPKALPIPFGRFTVTLRFAFWSRGFKVTCKPPASSVDLVWSLRKIELHKGC